MDEIIISTAGMQGPRGNTWLSVTGVPADTLGVDGDYALDQANPNSPSYYGPKTGGTWTGTGPYSIGSDIAGLLVAANNLSDLTSPSAARANLGLGSAATQASSAFDAAGAANSALSSAEANTSSAISSEVSRANGAYLSKTANLSDLSSASAARTSLGLGTAATAGSATTSAQGIVQLAGDLGGGTASAPQVTSTHLAAPLPIAQGGTAASSQVWADLLTPTAVKTGAYAAAPGDFIPVDTTSASVTVTLPTAPANLATIAVKMINGANTVTINTGGSDVINKSAGGTSLTLKLLNQGTVLQYAAGSAVWYVYGDDIPLSQLDARYLQAGNDLSELVSSAATARSNLGLGSAALQPTTAFDAADSLTYNAKNHGLVGDGVTNDQPALATLVSDLGALYASTGIPRIIYCPPSVYALHDNGTVWASGVSLIGAGPGITRFLLSNPVNTTNPTPLASFTVTYNGASTTNYLSDCTFADFEIDGSGVSLASYSTGAKGLGMQYMLRARFRNLYIHNTGATGLGCDFLQDSIIDGVVAEGCGRLNSGTQPGGAGIGIGTGGWGTSERTTIANCTAVGNGTHGIFLELQNSAWTPPRGYRVENCHLEGNTHGFSDWGCEGAIVSGCTIVNNLSDGINISANGVGSTAGRGGTIANCTIDGNFANGVSLGDTPGRYHVFGNRISNNGGYGYQQVSPVQGASSAASEMMIEDNDIYLNALDGIYTSSVLTDCYITANRIRNNGQQQSGSASNSGSTVTYTALALTDTAASWTVNGHLGKTVTVGSQTAVVTANSATVLTLGPYHPYGTTAWTTGTPATGTAYSLPAAPTVRAGITANAAMNSPTIRINRCWDNQTTHTQTHGLQITSSGTCSSGRVEGNDLLGNLTASTLLTTQPSGGYWTHNPGTTYGGAASTSTSLIDGPLLVGAVKYAGNTRNWVSSTITPSATANTAGTAQTCSPSSTQQGFGAYILVSVLFAGTFSSETATATFTATFSDNSTGTATLTSTSATRVNLAASSYISITKDGLYVKSVAVAMQSTIANSQTSATVNIVALQC